MDHLVIPDVHAKPGDEGKKRLTALGKLIVERRPEKIICIGDFADIPSLSFHDVGTKRFEGRSYRNDIKATEKAMKYLMTPLLKLQAKQRKNKKAIYKPKLVMVLGNHEDRITRYANVNAVMDGTVSLDDLPYAKYGWEVVPFLKPHVEDGITYVHYLVSGVMGRPVGGVNMGRSLLLNAHSSITVGHSHTVHIGAEVDANGVLFQSLCCGCFMEEGEDWNNHQSNAMWRSGVAYKHDVEDGHYDLEWISLERLLKETRID